MKNILSGRLVTDMFYHGSSLALVWSKFRFYGWGCAPSASANHVSKRSSDYKRVKSLFINWRTHIMYRYSLFFSKQACCFYWKWTTPAKSSWNFVMTGFIWGCPRHFQKGWFQNQFLGVNFLKTKINVKH